MRWRWCFSLILILCGFHSFAQAKDHFHRSYWYPMYHGERLAYCSKDEKKCGQQIANAYCQIMGYARVNEHRMAHNVGRVHYFNQEGECTGWKCDGFLLIGCEGEFKHKPAKQYMYRNQTFVYPRFEQHRVAWCFEENKSCGRRAAYSFCRRMAYSEAKSFKQDVHVAATRTLGDKVLCYGDSCQGFESITCRR